MLEVTVTSFTNFNMFFLYISAAILFLFALFFNVYTCFIFDINFIPGWKHFSTRVYMERHSSKSWDFMTNKDILIQTVEILMMNGVGFYDEQSTFSWWTVRISMMNGPEFYDDRWWQVKIFIMTGTELLYCFGLNSEGEGGSIRPFSF